MYVYAVNIRFMVVVDERWWMMRHGTLVPGSGRPVGDADWPGTPPRVASAAELPPSPSLPRVKVLHVITRLEAGAGGNTLLSAQGMDPARSQKRHGCDWRGR